MRKHIISLYTLATILLISQVFTLSMLTIRTNQIYKELNSTYVEFKSDQIETLSKIKELTENLQKTQSSLTEQLDELKAGASADFSGIIENSIDSVVTIITDVSQGTGFIIGSKGYIVTNAHVLYGAHYVNAITSEKETLKSGLIGYDRQMDLAVLKIKGDFEALELDNSNNVKIGEKVIAIGNPLGLSFSATEGIISGVERKGPNGLEVYLQTDVALNPGNSGGPLINTKGEVIGINNFKVGGYEGLGFALESNELKKTVNQITLKAVNATIIS